MLEQSALLVCVKNKVLFLVDLCLCEVFGLCRLVPKHGALQACARNKVLFLIATLSICAQNKVLFSVGLCPSGVFVSCGFHTCAGCLASSCSKQGLVPR